MTYISVNKNTLCTNISVPRSLTSFLAIVIIFCVNFYSVRGIDTRSDKKQNEGIHNKKLANKTKKMSNTDLTKTAVEPLIHENTNKSQTCS